MLSELPAEAVTELSELSTAMEPTLVLVDPDSLTEANSETLVLAEQDALAEADKLAASETLADSDCEFVSRCPSPLS